MEHVKAGRSEPEPSGEHCPFCQAAVSPLDEVCPECGEELFEEPRPRRRPRNLRLGWSEPAA